MGMPGFGMPGESRVGISWQNLVGKLMGKARGNVVGILMGKSWERSDYENHGKTHGKGPWEMSMGNQRVTCAWDSGACNRGGKGIWEKHMGPRHGNEGWEECMGERSRKNYPSM